MSVFIANAVAFGAAANDILQRLVLSHDSEALFLEAGPTLQVQVSCCSYFLYRGQDESAASELCRKKSGERAETFKVSL